MKRCEFIMLIGSAAAVWPLAGGAQQVVNPVLSMELSNCAQRLNRRSNIGLVRALIIYSLLGFTLVFGPQALSDETDVTTQLTCSSPEVPTLFLTLELGRDAAILEHALHTNVCQYTDEPTPISPIFFLRTVKTTQGAVKPFGYIWAVRVGERKMRYSYFWKDAHDKMLGRIHSN